MESTGLGGRSNGLDHGIEGYFPQCPRHRRKVYIIDSGCSIEKLRALASESIKSVANYGPMRHTLLRVTSSSGPDELPTSSACILFGVTSILIRDEHEIPILRSSSRFPAVHETLLKWKHSLLQLDSFQSAPSTLL